LLAHVEGSYVRSLFDYLVIVLANYVVLHYTLRCAVLFAEILF